MEGAKRKEKRSYFCKPCGYKHECPTNAKCARQKLKGRPEDGDGETGDRRDPAQPGPSGEPSQTRARHRRRTDDTPVTPRTSKRRRVVSNDTPSEQASPECRSFNNAEGTHPSLLVVLNKLEAIAAEGRTERERLATQSRADREYFRSAIAALQTRNDVLSDDEDQVLDKQKPKAAGQIPGPETAGKSGLSAADLVVGPNPLQTLRDDRPSARAANEVLRRQTSGDDSSKKLKSGYNLTINDTATVVAQWPQMNVFRNSNDTATYNTLSVNEFCSGYMLYIQDCLNNSPPDVVRALDYIDYLHDLLDDIPLIGWERVRAAHGELLRLVEQGRLLWSDIPARSKAINKALRRAQLAGEPQPSQSSGDKTIVGSAQKSNNTPSNNAPKKPCPQYQTNSCDFASAHVSEGVVLLHCCATCLRTRNQKYSHPRASCKRQRALEDKAAPKNE